MNQNTYCVIYRTGGSDRFAWNRSAAMTSDQAVETSVRLTKEGYSCHVEQYQRSLNLGLPETFSVNGK